MQYSEKKIMRILKGEADVPKEVTARIDQTIRQIKENSDHRSGTSGNGSEKINGCRDGRYNFACD